MSALSQRGGFLAHLAVGEGAFEGAGQVVKGEVATWNWLGSDPLIRGRGGPRRAGRRRRG